MKKKIMGQTYTARILGLAVLLPLLTGPRALSAELPKEGPNSDSRPTASAGGSAQNPTAGRLLILEGQGVHNSISSKTAISPVVQLLSGDGHPIAEAEVVFQAPATGPGGQFGLGPIATTKTDRVGQATARFTPNTQPGRFAIQVKAKWPGGTAEATIVQYNDANLGEPAARISRRPWYRDWRVWAAAGGAAGVSTWLVQRNGNGQPMITIIPSPVGIGGAR